jgi:hypothetical protein
MIRVEEPQSYGNFQATISHLHVTTLLFSFIGSASQQDDAHFLLQGPEAANWQRLGLSLFIRVGWKEFISLLLEAVEEAFTR